MTKYITKRIHVIFRCVFEGILAYLVSKPKSTPDFPGLPRTSLDFPGLFLVFEEIMPDKVILDHSHIWSILKIFIFCDFFTNGQFLLKIENNKNFQS